MHIENPTTWGIKRICQGCQTKYYDLKRSPIICPKCGAAFVELAKAKRASAGNGESRTRTRAESSNHASSPWARRTGAHSPFAEGRGRDDDETPDDDDKAESSKGDEPEARESEDDSSS